MSFIRKNLMLALSMTAVLASFFISPPDGELLSSIDWRTLANLFMLLTVLEGFKKESLFEPVVRVSFRIGGVRALCFFLVFSVFFSSMFVTNDVSLLVFVPITITIFRRLGKERHIVPLLVLENIAAVRGSLLTPFGSPQNLFLFTESGIPVHEFMGMMAPLTLMSAVLLCVFILVLTRGEHGRVISGASVSGGEVRSGSFGLKMVYCVLFAVVVSCIVSRTRFVYLVALALVLALLAADRKVFGRVDYALLLTFLCFFAFSSSVTRNQAVSEFFGSRVAGNEYIWSLLLSQVISNVPASIVLWPFCSDLRALLYGLDSAGLISVIGSLASVINLRLYNREFPGKSGEFMKKFEFISLAFFAIVAAPQYFIIVHFAG